MSTHNGQDIKGGRQKIVCLGNEGYLTPSHISRGVKKIVLKIPFPLNEIRSIQEKQFKAPASACVVWRMTELRRGAVAVQKLNTPVQLVFVTILRLVSIHTANCRVISCSLRKMLQLECSTLNRLFSHPFR